MATVLRVRRKRTSDPAESLVFSCSASAKKARPADGASAPKAGGDGVTSAGKTTARSQSTEDVKKVFKFAGTVGRKDEPIATRIEEAIKKASQQPAITSSKPTKSTTKSKSSKNKSKTREKSRVVQQKASQARRYQVLNSQRGIDLQELDSVSQNPAPKKSAPVKRTPSKLKIWNRLKKSSSSSSTDAPTEDEVKKLFRLYDVAQQEGKAPITNGEAQSPTSPTGKDSSANPDVVMCNSVQMIREKLVIDGKDREVDYVYDLYYIEEGQLDLMNGESATEAEVLMEYFVTQGEEDEDVETYEDDSDSNEEGNWRNDYPEDEPDKRHPDLFDELIDDYCYGDQSSDEDFGQYADVKKKTGKRAINYNAYGSDDDLGCYS